MPVFAFAGPEDLPPSGPRDEHELDLTTPHIVATVEFTQSGGIRLTSRERTFTPGTRRARAGPGVLLSQGEALELLRLMLARFPLDALGQV